MTSTSASPLLPAAPPEQTERWTPRRVALLVALMWPTQLLAVAGIIGANTFAGIAQAFHTTQVAWAGLIGALVSTPLTPFIIKLGDRYGKRRLMLAMIGLGVIGDVIAASADSFGMLLAGRAIAACYGPFAVLAFPAVRDLFPARLVRPATAYLGSSISLVAIVAPFLGGWLIDGWGFRAGLWFIAIATAVAFLLVLTLVPETPRHDFQEGFDWQGGLLLGASMTGFVYVLGQAHTWGWSDARTVGWLAGSLVVGLAFLTAERRCPHPILNLGLLGRRPVAVALAVSSLAQVTVFSLASVEIMLATYPRIPGVSDGLGWSAWHNAEVGVGWNLLMLAAGYAAGRLLRRTDPRLIWRAGLVLAAVGFGLQGFFHADVLQLVLTSCVANVGMGFIVAAAPVLVLGVVTKDEQGQGSGAQQLITNVLGAVVVAGLFAILGAHSKVLHGTAFYLDAGWSMAFWAGALIMVVVLALSSFLPPLRDPELTDAEPASALAS